MSMSSFLSGNARVLAQLQYTAKQEGLPAAEMSYSKQTLGHNVCSPHGKELSRSDRSHFGALPRSTRRRTPSGYPPMPGRDRQRLASLPW